MISRRIMALLRGLGGRTVPPPAPALSPVLCAAIETTALAMAADRRGRITELSPGLADLIGTPRDHLLRRRIDTILPPGTGRTWRRTWAEAFRVHGRWRGELRLIDAAHRPHWIDLTIEPAAAFAPGWVAVGHDITERVIRNVTFHAVEHALEDAAVAMMVVEGPARRLTYVNDVTVEQTGFTRDELLKATPELAERYGYAGMLAALDPVFDDPPRPVEFSTQLRRRDGSDLIIDVAARPADVAGGPRRAVLVWRDVTGWVRDQAELREVSAALDAAADCVFIADPSDMRFVYANRAASDHVGFSPAELHRMRVHQVNAEYSLSRLKALHRRLAADPTAVACFRSTHRRSDGRTIPVEINVRFVPNAGPRGRLIAIARDLSERLEHERRLDEAREAAEEASRAKSEFLANMSHEIRTPMTAILGFAELLESDDGDADQEHRVDAVAAIRRNGRHMLDLINDILDMSKIEAGRMTVENIETNPAALIDEVAALNRIAADEKGLDLVVEYTTPLPALVRTDPVRLRQIVANLVNNAIKFTERGAVRVRVGHEPDARRIRITVSDTGIGMSPEQLDRIGRFDAFTQANASTTRRFGGTGLGLCISRSLAAMLGGEIHVDSQEGTGSTFTLDIDAEPVGERMLAAACTVLDLPADPPPACPLIGARILLAEDGPDNQRLIRHHLARAGAEVELAENGRVAVEAAIRADRDGRPFNLILMDMQMPELDGYAACRELRNRGYQQPIVALTAHAMSGDRDLCVEAGCDDYATKPIDTRALLECCRRWFAHGRAA